jgi:hypothetical protein
LRSRGPTAVSASSISRFFGGSLERGQRRSFYGRGFYRALDRIDLSAYLRRKRGLDVFDHGLKLLVRQVLERIAVLDLVFARDQQSQNLEVGGRLCPAHLRNGLLPVLPEVTTCFAVQTPLATRDGVGFKSRSGEPSLDHPLRSSSEVYDFTHARCRALKEPIPTLHRYSVWRILREIAEPVGRSRGPGRPWLWRLKTPAADHSSRAVRLRSLKK